jgi:hypothetical protein
LIIWTEPPGLPETTFLGDPRLWWTRERRVELLRAAKNGGRIARAIRAAVDLGDKDLLRTIIEANRPGASGQGAKAA